MGGQKVEADLACGLGGHAGGVDAVLQAEAVDQADQGASEGVRGGERGGRSAEGCADHLVIGQILCPVHLAQFGPVRDS